MVFALIPIILVVIVVVVLVTRKGKSGAAEPTEWPTPESSRPQPSHFSDLGRDATPEPGLRVTPPAEVASPAPAVPVEPAPPAARAEPSAPEQAAPEQAAPAKAAPAPVTPEAEAPATAVADDLDDDEPDDEPDLSRFGVPSPRKVVAPPAMPKAQVRHLEAPAAAAPAPAPAAAPDPEPAPAAAPAPRAEDLVGGPATDDPPGLQFEDETLELRFDSLDEATIDLDAQPEPEPPPEPLPDSDEPAGSDGRERSAEEVELDLVIGALIDQAKANDQSVVDVATELVERAELDESEQSQTISALIAKGEPADLVNIADRLSELTLFNSAVPSKPGALTQFMDLDPLTRKRVIVRVLCLLVARSETEMKALPKNPASAAETRQWPLARAVWPVPAKKVDDDADLPNRGLGARS